MSEAPAWGRNDSPHRALGAAHGGGQHARQMGTRALRNWLAALALALAGCAQPPPSTDLVFVSDEAANVVHIVDGATGRIEGSLATGRRPRGMQVSPDGRTLYVAASNSNRIEAWDVRTRRLVRLLASGLRSGAFRGQPGRAHALHRQRGP